MKKTSLFLVLLILAGGAPVLAQFETASVLGTVRDATGAIVPGATVTLLNVDTGVAQSKATDADGNYEFFTVRIGTYRAARSTTSCSTAWTTTPTAPATRASRTRSCSRPRMRWPSSRSSPTT